MGLLVMQVSDHNSELQESRLVFVYAFSLLIVIHEDVQVLVGDVL